MNHAMRPFDKIFPANNTFDVGIRAPLRATCLSCFQDSVPTFWFAFTRRKGVWAEGFACIFKELQLSCELDSWDPNGLSERHGMLHEVVLYYEICCY